VCAVTLVVLAAPRGPVHGATFDIVPVRADVGFSISDQEIVLDSVPAQVEVQVLVSGFGKESVAAYQGVISCASLVSDVEGKLLAIATDCTYGGGIWDVDYCLGVNENEPTYILAGASESLESCQNIASCPDGDPGAFACGSVAIFGDSGADNASAYYAMTFAFDVPGDFKGTATFTLDPDPGGTFIKNVFAEDIPIDAVNPARITLPVGACCGDGGNLQCRDNVTSAECGGAAWQIGQLCSGQKGFCGLDETCCLCGCVGLPKFCDDNNACTYDFCDPVSCCNSYDTTPDGQCCDPWTGSLTPIDDGDDCTDDECQPDGSVTHEPAAAGTSCDDANICTVSDECDGEGGCAGTDTNSLSCNDISDCPPGSQGCDEGFCVCDLETLVSLIVNDGDHPDTSCFDAGDHVTVDVLAGPGSTCVAGAQFLVQYDPTCLAFDGFAFGDTFALGLFFDHDEAGGTIFAAVGVAAGQSCSFGPDLLGRMSFTKLDGCGECVVSFVHENPLNTVLADEYGNAVPIELVDSRAIRLAGELTLETPEGVFEFNPGCDVATAEVTWEDLFASDSCDLDAPPIMCKAIQNKDVYVADLIFNGGTFPLGTTTFVCTTTNSCGDTVTNEWVVNVPEKLSMEAEIHLGGGLMLGDPLSRCICFDFYADCVQAPTNWCATLDFGFPYEFAGRWRGELEVSLGPYACLAARDPFHTLRSVSDVECVDNVLVAAFEGDPALGGNSLIGGNLDGWSTSSNADIIDILDFAILIEQYLAELDPNTTCKPDQSHADINGDGIVDAPDFVFISQNFLAQSKNTCCEETVAGTEVPLASVSLKQLRRWGLEHLAVADLDGSGVVDAADMTAFARGVLPRRVARTELGKQGRSHGR
jgi:hypothetical protein